MKTTNYEISKKLKEIGFKKKSDFLYTQGVKGDEQTYYLTYHNEEQPHGWELQNPILAYDLETILVSLPRRNLELKFYEHHEPDDQNNIIGYEYPKIWVEQQEGESLVDMAARLLIKFREKFGGENG